MIRKLRYLLSTLCCIAFINSRAQVTRGWQPGEIYLSSPWYYTENNSLYSGIFYSKDNGRTLGLCYKSLEDTDSMPPFFLVADEMPGVLYNYSYYQFYRSFNYGHKWQFVSTNNMCIYIGGYFPGEVYRITQDLLISINYGSSFTTIINNFTGAISEIGLKPGEFFGLGSGDYPPFTFYHSSDTGLNFESYILEPEIGGHSVQGHYPKLSRGTSSGEIYLISWHLPANYKIFRSTDFGQHFNLQYISDTCDFYFENYAFTAGKAPGSFYVVKYDSRYWGDMTEVTISYSSDSAQTFTSYVHHLDAAWVDTAYNAVNYPDKQNAIYIFQNFPNPFSDKTTFQYQIRDNEKNVCLEIFNLSGNLIQIIPLKNSVNSIQVDFTCLQNGIYLYRLKTSSFISKPCKLIKN